MGNLTRRVSRLERSLPTKIEVEDLRASEIEIYGEDAVAAIYEREGAESLRELLDSDSLGELEAALVSAFLKAHERRRGKRDQ